jgi:hypothetical protein
VVLSVVILERVFGPKHLPWTVLAAVGERQVLGLDVPYQMVLVRGLLPAHGAPELGAIFSDEGRDVAHLLHRIIAIVVRKIGRVPKFWKSKAEGNRLRGWS